MDVARQQNALHIAASTNCTNTNVINFILGNVPSGSINMKNRWGNTPLDMAKLFNSNINAVEILKSNGGKTKEEINEDSDSECSKDSHMTTAYVTLDIKLQWAAALISSLVNNWQKCVQKFTCSL